MKVGFRLKNNNNGNTRDRSGAKPNRNEQLGNWLFEVANRHPRSAKSIAALAIIVMVTTFLVRFVLSALALIAAPNNNGGVWLFTQFFGLFSGLIVIGSILFALSLVLIKYLKQSKAVALSVNTTKEIVGNQDAKTETTLQEKKDGNN